MHLGARPSEVQIPDPPPTTTSKARTRASHRCLIRDEVVGIGPPRPAGLSSRPRSNPSRATGGPHRGPRAVPTRGPQAQARPPAHVSPKPGARGQHRGHVAGRAGDLPGLGDPRELATSRRRHAEVNHFDRAVGGEHQVLRLHVPVDQEAAWPVTRTAHPWAPINATQGVGSAPCSPKLADRVARQQLHHQEQVLVLAEVVDARDAGVPEPCGDPGLSVEAAAHVLVGVRHADQLDRNGTVEPQVGAVPYLAHAAPRPMGEVTRYRPAMSLPGLRGGIRSSSHAK